MRVRSLGGCFLAFHANVSMYTHPRRVSSETKPRTKRTPQVETGRKTGPIARFAVARCPSTSSRTDVTPWQKAVARRRGELRAAVRLAPRLATHLVARLATSLRRKRHPLLVQELTTRGATATRKRVPRIFRSAKRPLPSNLPRIPRFEGLVPTFEKRGTTCPTYEIWATLALTTRSHTWVLGRRTNLSIAVINVAPAAFYRAVLSVCLGVQTKISRRRQLWSIVPKRSSSGMSGI